MFALFFLRHCCLKVGVMTLTAGASEQMDLIFSKKTKKILDFVGIAGKVIALQTYEVSNGFKIFLI